MPAPVLTLVRPVVREIRELDAEPTSQTVALRHGLDTAESGIRPRRHLAPDFEAGIVPVQRFGGPGTTGDGFGRFAE
ncbi:MAG: hypothetical protein AUI89_05145 [Gemmatimonadetes bacterium 13_1_40CM_3_65_8]|nr:MAG: hypothetical protein AUI89_05145 [Gemmatimonadetes bacterium 13_1_40CM_3_65_8]